MSKECFPHCPRIQRQLSDISSDNFIAAVGPIHSDMFGGKTGADALVDICESTYDCEGVASQELTVIKGVFKKREETQTEYRCQHPEYAE